MSNECPFKFMNLDTTLNSARPINIQLWLTLFRLQGAMLIRPVNRCDWFPVWFEDDIVL